MWISAVCAGTLPSSWALPGAFPALFTLALWDTLLNGHLPASWGQNGSFTALKNLQLASMGLTGSLPAQWGGPKAWQGLQNLSILNSSITGGHAMMSSQSARRVATVSLSPKNEYQGRWFELCVTRRHMSSYDYIE